MYEFDWSSIIPSLPYLLAGLVITAEDHRHRRCRGDSLGNHSGRHAPLKLCSYRLVC
ncbi:glutamate/aspartate transporter permease GltK [Salmonella enterica subsp. enterica]|nr:glutamate/aspartate transporter permease GltK [Salmonella enterica subsp. enterica]